MKGLKEGTNHHSPSTPTSKYRLQLQTENLRTYGTYVRFLRIFSENYGIFAKTTVFFGKTTVFSKNRAP